MEYDPRYQTRKNGPLTKEVRSRLTRFRERGYTLAEIAQEFKFSGPFISQLLNEKAPASVRTIHIPRIIERLEKAEIDEGITMPREKLHQPLDIGRVSLEELINAIAAKGFDVTVTPRTR
jgi:transcriptional regulator with XRE-family HTH domain